MATKVKGLNTIVDAMDFLRIQPAILTSIYKFVLLITDLGVMSSDSCAG